MLYIFPSETTLLNEIEFQVRKHIEWLFSLTFLKQGLKHLGVKIYYKMIKLPAEFIRN